MKKIDKISIFFYFAIFAALWFLPVSCKKLVEAPAPESSLNTANVFDSDLTAIAAMTGIYTKIITNTLATTSLDALTVPTGLSSDELTLVQNSTNLAYAAYYANALNSSVTNGADFWQSIYPIIYLDNSVLEGVSNSNKLSTPVKQQLIGEAKFLRAWCYFYLVNFYGDVPLALTTDYKINNLLPRASKSLVWQQIISDLQDAQNTLSTSYVDGTLLAVSPERVRPSKWAATALLSKCYLYTGDFANALTQASAVINNSTMFSLSSINNVFLKASLSNKEAIWQMQPVNSGQNTPDAIALIIPATGPSTSFSVYLSPQLLNSFETGDLRKTNWVNSVTASGITYYYPFKYKVNALNAPVTEYQMELRLGELVLIRAEAEANGAGGGISAAINDLNGIRNRAGLGNYAGLQDKSSVLTAIAHERQVELFTEGGNRWLDLKRSGTVDAVMSTVTPLKGGTWKSTSQYFPVPLSDLRTDPNLVQNAGY